LIEPGAAERMDGARRSVDARKDVGQHGIDSLARNAALATQPALGRAVIAARARDQKLLGFSTMQHIVQRMRNKLGLPKHFTFDACRHGGMTELEEAELTEGQGRALSAHRTQQSYAGYAKRTEARMLSATRKRHAHRLANEMATSVQNETPDGVQNENSDVAKSA
jgi:hypothetical protein